MDILVQTFVGVLLLANIFIIYYQFRESLYKLYDQYSPNQFRLSLGSPTVSPLNDQILVEEKSYEVLGISDVVNLRQCVGRPFRVYVHDLNSTTSSLAQSFHEEMKRSPYATKEVVNACLSVYIAVDVNENISSLPFWRTNGMGVIVIFIDGKVREKQVGEKQATFVGMSDAIERSNGPLDLNLYTNVMIPDPKNYEHLPVIYPFRQRLYLLSLLVSTATPQVQEVFSSDSNISLVELKCRGSTSLALGFCEDDEFRATTLNNSVFTMLMPEMERFAQRFHESLLYGAVPVIVSNDLNSLPFAQQIRWNKAVIHVPAHLLFDIEKILQTISTSRILELRRNGRFYLENYFADTKVLARSLLTAIRNQLRLPAPLERAYHSNVILTTGLNGSTSSPPIVQKNHIMELDEDLDYVWNVNPVYLDSRPLQPIREMSHVLADIDSLVPGLQTINVDNKHFAGKLSGNYVVEKFTGIFKNERDKQLRYTLKMLNGTRFLDSVVVLWNDIARPLPSDLIPTISVPIYVVKCVCQFIELSVPALGFDSNGSGI
ncbi:Exostosin-2 [Aphelenchoides besseyi]|nr:Exostosin-2 [Aphelenchoides besseyi]